MSPEGERGRPLASHRRRRRASIHVLVEDAVGGAGAAADLARWLADVAPARARGMVSLAILGDQRVRRLNRQYLGRDYATDVLSFPAESSRPPRTAATRRIGPAGNRPARAPVSSVPSVVESFLGDIAIARGVARRQARAAGHSEMTELRLLALHGLLHLLGYDHELDRGEMHRMEQRLRRKGGLPKGLIERAQAARSSTLRQAQDRPVEPRARRR